MATDPMDFSGVVQASIDSVFQGGNWLASCVLALIISAVMSSLAWMLSTAFQSNELRGWAKKEISEFIITGALISMMFPLLTIISGLSIAYVGGDPFDIASKFIDKVQLDLTSTFTHVVTLKATFTLISSFELPLSLVVKLIATVLAFLGLTASTLGTAAAPTAVASVLAFFANITLPYGNPISLVTEPLSSLEGMMRPIFLAFFVQKELLLIIQKIMLPILLPLGILLRAFPLTRKTGSTLIALSLVAYVIYPVSLVFAKGMYESTYSALKLEYGDLNTKISFTSESGLYYQISPAPGKYYLSYTDMFEWVALKNFSYSIWSEISCTALMGASYSSDSSDLNIKYTPPPADYVYWKITENEEIETYDLDGKIEFVTVPIEHCYKKIKHGKVVAGDTFSQEITQIIFANNAQHRMLIAANPALPDTPKTSNISFYLGSRCGESLWSSSACLLSTSYRENAVNDIGYLNLAGIGTMGFFKGLQSFTTSMLGSVKDGAFLSPVVAGYMFLYLTEKLPVIMFPYLMVLFNFVIVIFVFTISFKSISSVIGGETEIIELGRLV